MESLDTDTDSAQSSSSDAITSTAATKTKKKSKKKNQGSDLALFVAFPFVVLAILVSILTIVSFIQIESIGYFADFCAGMRAQYILVLVLCIVPAMFAPSVRMPTAIGCALFALINLCMVGPCLLPPKELTKEVKDLRYLRFRVMQFTIPDRDTKLDSIIKEISRTNPDVVCLTGAPLQQMWDLTAKMPPQFIHRTQLPWDGYCIAIYSRVPLKDVKVKKVGPEKLPVMVAGIQFDYGWFRAILVNAPQPKDNDSLESRNEYLKAVAELAKKTPGREIVLGTFNTTPYSVAYSDFQKNSELVDTRMGNGVQPNWHLFNFDSFFFRMPVDHIFVDSRVVTLGRYVCGAVEDLRHKPLIIDLCPSDQNKDPDYKGEADPPEPPTKAAPPPADAKAPAQEAKKGPSAKGKKRGK